MEFKDYYKILGVAENADDKSIKTAYRKLARQYHPDVSQEADAENKFKEITEAYEVLKSKDKRAEYDELRKYGRNGRFQPPPDWQNRAGGGQEQEFYHGDFSEFFNSIFGNAGGARSGFRGFEGFTDGAHFNQNAKHKGEDIEAELAVFLEDTLAEESKTIHYQIPHIDGRGMRSFKEKTLKVKIPAGVADGERIRLKNQGAPGFNGGENGDLFLRIRLVPHPLFDVQGHDLYVTVPIAPWEAVLGAKIVVPTLDGKVSLSIPANSQAGQKLRIKGKGLPTKTGRGDLLAVLKIVVPKADSEQQKQAWQTLAEASNYNPRSDRQ